MAELMDHPDYRPARKKWAVGSVSVPLLTKQLTWTHDWVVVGDGVIYESDDSDSGVEYGVVQRIRDTSTSSIVFEVIRFRETPYKGTLVATDDLMDVKHVNLLRKCVILHQDTPGLDYGLSTLSWGQDAFTYGQRIIVDDDGDGPEQAVRAPRPMRLPVSLRTLAVKKSRLVAVLHKCLNTRKPAPRYVRSAGFQQPSGVPIWKLGKYKLRTACEVTESELLELVGPLLKPARRSRAAIMRFQPSTAAELQQLLGQDEDVPWNAKDDGTVRVEVTAGDLQYWEVLYIRKTMQLKLRVAYSRFRISDGVQLDTLRVADGPTPNGVGAPPSPVVVVRRGMLGVPTGSDPGPTLKPANPGLPTG